MSPPDKPPKAGHKPFLGDDELSNELDAWDEMFDGLHGGPEASAADEPVMAWPAPAAEVPVVPVVQVAPVAQEAARGPERAPTQIEPDEAGSADGMRELDEQLSLDRAVSDETSLDLQAAPPHERASTSVYSSDAPDEDPLETDFSDIGAAGSASALGDFLGARARSETRDGDGSNDPATGIHPRGGTPVPVDEDDIEDVYTSASRPNVAPAADDDEFTMDVVAPPPPARKPPPSAPHRTGPAIIRRATPVAVPLGNFARPSSPAAEDSPFSENTRVAELGEIESQRAEARSKAPTAPPPYAFTADSEPAVLDDDDDYADIEIASETAESEATPAEAAAPRRTAAHVVRRPERPEQSTKPQPAPHKRDSEPVIEVADSVPVEPSAEDDFSDVAAAVGVGDELGFESAPVPRRRPETPQYGIDVRSGSSSAFPSSRPDLEAVLDDFDDHDDLAGDTAHVHVHAPEEVLPEEVLSEEVDLGDTRLDVTRAAEREAPDAPEHLEAPDPTRTLYGLGAVGAAARASRPSRPPELDAAQAGRRHARLQTPLPISDDVAEVEPSIDLEAIRLPEQVQPLPSSQLDEAFARSLEIYERELATIDETATSAALRLEAGRLCERLGEADRARTHYDAALLADPRATGALRGLRRIARANGDLDEATRHLDTELAVAGALERRPLGHHRIDLLMASGDQDLARVAVGEILDSAPSDVRALLAQLELAFLDGRADEFGGALEQLAHAVTDPELRAAVQSARGVLAAHHHDTAAAATWFTAAAESDPSSLGARLGAIRQAVTRNDGAAAANVLLDLARQVETTDPMTAAALAVRAQHWARDGQCGAARDDRDAARSTRAARRGRDCQRRQRSGRRRQRVRGLGGERRRVTHRTLVRRRSCRRARSGAGGRVVARRAPARSRR